MTNHPFQPDDASWHTTGQRRCVWCDLNEAEHYTLDDNIKDRFLALLRERDGAHTLGSHRTEYGEQQQ